MKTYNYRKQNEKWNAKIEWYFEHRQLLKTANKEVLPK